MTAADNGAMPVRETADGRVLDDLFAVIAGRRGADPETSYTARLFAKGAPKIACKVGEEATETVVAALAESRERLAAESADLLFHLLVLWAAAGLSPESVWQELAARHHRAGSPRGGGGTGR